MNKISENTSSKNPSVGQKFRYRIQKIIKYISIISLIWTFRYLFWTIYTHYHNWNIDFFGTPDFQYRLIFSLGESIVLFWIFFWIKKINYLLDEVKKMNDKIRKKLLYQVIFDLLALWWIIIWWLYITQIVIGTMFSFPRYDLWKIVG